MSKALNLDVSDGIARVILSRPEVHNAFDDSLIDELHQLFHQVAEDPNARVLALRGKGKSFCAGADLNWMERMATYTEAQNLGDAQRLADMLHALYSIPKPTVAVVHGAAFGGGVGLAACCDIALAGPRANFCLSEVKLGLIPATISPFVSEAIGARATRKLTLTAERFDGQQAHQLGLVHEVLADDEQLHARADELCHLLAGYGSQTLAAVKTLMAHVSGQPITDVLHADTAQRIAHQRCTPEGREGVAAFLAKRNPQWPD